MDLNDSQSICVSCDRSHINHTNQGRPLTTRCIAQSPNRVGTPLRCPSPIKHLAGSLTPVARARQLQSQYEQRESQSPTRANYYEEHLVDRQLNSQMQSTVDANSYSRSNSGFTPLLKSPNIGESSPPLPYSLAPTPISRSVTIPTTTTKVITSADENGNDNDGEFLTRVGPGCDCSRERGGGGNILGLTYTHPNSNATYVQKRPERSNTATQIQNITYNLEASPNNTTCDQFYKCNVGGNAANVTYNVADNVALNASGGDNSYDLDSTMDFEETEYDHSELPSLGLYSTWKNDPADFNVGLLRSPVGMAIPGPSCSGRTGSPRRSPAGLSGVASGDSGCCADGSGGTQIVPNMTNKMINATTANDTTDFYQGIRPDAQSTPNKQIYTNAGQGPHCVPLYGMQILQENQGIPNVPIAQRAKSAKLANEVQRHLSDLESSERERINNDLTKFQQARRRLVHGTTTISSCKPAINLNNPR